MTAIDPPSKEEGNYEVEVVPVIQFEFTNKDDIISDLR
jgi:hypothetical protein